MDNAFEINAAATDSQLNGAEPAVVPPHVDIVMILSPVHMGIAEIIPAPFLRVHTLSASANKSPMVDNMVFFNTFPPSSLAGWAPTAWKNSICLRVR